MKLYKRIVAAILCAGMLFSIIACGNATLGDESVSLELVDVPVTTLDNVWYNPGGIFRCAVFDSLLSTNAEMTEYRPALAKVYTVSKDALSYEFQLQNNVKWHDGEKFDAEDVIFSIKAALKSDEVNGIIASTFSCIKGAEEFVAGATEEISGIEVDGDAITFHLDRPTGRFLDAIAQFAILPEHILGTVEPTRLPENEYWSQPIGTGCYKIVEAVEGEYFLLEENNDYYGAKPGIKSIRLRVNLEDCVEEMKAGTLDFYITNDPEEIAELNGVESCSAHPLNIMFPTYLLANISNDEGTNDPLKDVRVRKALLLAVDRNTIVEAIFPGSEVSNTMIPTWDPYYLEGAEAYEFNPEKAKQLLEESGFDFTKELRLRYSTSGAATRDLMNAIAVYWRAIGVNVNVEKFEGSGSKHMFEVRDYDVCYKRLSAFDYASVYEEVQGDAVMQTKVFGQPVYDELLKDLTSTNEESSRQALIAQMQELDQEYLLRMPLFSLANIAYVNEEHFQMPDAYGNLWYRYDLCFDEWKMVK